MRRFKKILLCIIIVALSTTLYSQQLSDSVPRQTILQILKYDGITAFGGVKHAYSRPFHWQKDDFITAGTVIAGTALLYSFDEESSRFFIRQDKKAPRVLKDFGFYFGKPQQNRDHDDLTLCVVCVRNVLRSRAKITC